MDGQKGTRKENLRTRRWRKEKIDDHLKLSNMSRTILFYKIYNSVRFSTNNSQASIVLYDVSYCKNFFRPLGSGRRRQGKTVYITQNKYFLNLSCHISFFL